LRDETCEGQPCFERERYLANKYSGYKRQVVWMDKATCHPWKIDYYGRKDSLLKAPTIKGYKKYLNKHWRTDEMFMINHQTGKSTRHRFRAGLADAGFTQDSLKRAR